MTHRDVAERTGVSVVGYDDISSAAYLNPPLTTVRFPRAEMGRLAGEMLLKPLRGEEWPARTVTPPAEPAVRELAAPPRREGPSGGQNTARAPVLSLRAWAGAAPGDRPPQGRRDP